MVMAGLRSHRCLLILDNLDTILSNQTGYYREGYEAYGELLRRIGVEQHSSHLLITSREHPKSLATLEGEALPIRSLRLAGLEVIDIQVIGQTSGCVAETEQEWQTLTRQYSGNPLAIKIISTVVRNLFDGKLTHFLQQGAISFGDIRLLLDEHFQRLSILEQHILILACHQPRVGIVKSITRRSSPISLAEHTVRSSTFPLAAIAD
ncbi:hypothetical protein [Leptothermofonsia sp. ETS-13]|uniref:hypothetical protein n=1 Tax=Leptothermofonsia sp. ETS-13 TaxID=3035696 RepID=UPI003BA15176